jgi:hypothetical protein
LQCKKVFLLAGKSCRSTFGPRCANRHRPSPITRHVRSSLQTDYAVLSAPRSGGSFGSKIVQF